MIFKLYFILISTVLFALVKSIPINEDAQSCMELCASCNGIATFADGKCECDIGENGNEGAECFRRMRREVGDSGFNLISCDIVGDDRKTRCTLGSKHFHSRNSIDQVAKYFMKDGPITGSIFKAPPYSVKSKSQDCAERSQLVSHRPLDTLSRANYAAPPGYNPPPQQVIINLPQGYVPNGSPVTGSASPETMTGIPQLIIQPHVAPVSPAENLDAPQLITQPKEVMPTDIVESPHIITQPTDLIPPVTSEPAQPDEPEPSEIHFVKNEPCDSEPISVDKQKIKAPTFEMIRPSLSRDFANIRMVELPKTIAPLFMQSLLQHLSQPMLGIPQAVQTITKAPGISQIVSAPGNLLNSLVNRLSARKGGDGGSDTKSNGGDGGDDDSLKFATNSQLFTQYNPDLYKLYVNPGDDFSTVLGSENPYGASHVLVHPMYAQSPMIAGYSPYEREYVPHVPSYIVGSSLPMPYFDSDESYIPIYTDVPKMEHFINEANDPKIERTQASQEKTPTPTKEVLIEIPVLKPKKICKKSSKDESSKKVTRDIKAISERINEESMDANEKNQNQAEATQDGVRTHESTMEKTSDQARKDSATKMKTEKAKTEISSKIKKKSKGEKKFD